MRPDSIWSHSNDGYNTVRTRRYFPLFVVTIAFVVLGGCNSGPPIAPVTGVLTYKGKAVPNVHLEFIPEQGRPSWGLTDAAGRFALEYDRDNKGALVGKHKVYAKMGPFGANVSGERPDTPKELAELFDKYSATNSTVVVEIAANTREIKLAWD